MSCICHGSPSPYGHGASLTDEIISDYFPYATPYAPKILFGFIRVFFPMRQLKDSLHWIAYCKFCAAGSAQAFEAWKTLTMRHDLFSVIINIILCMVSPAEVG